MMNSHFHMQDQVKDRINTIMQENHFEMIDEFAQTAVTLLIVFVFLTFGLAW